jgi:uncharacterized protein
VGAVIAPDLSFIDASAHERAIVKAQLGRAPRTRFRVAAMCPHGLVGVIENAPRSIDGTPFPTLYWLTCPIAVREVSRLESAGRMRELESMLTHDSDLAERYRAAHGAYLARRADVARATAVDTLDEPASAGGMPDRVKCLHALYAHELAAGNPVGALVRAEIEPLPPGPCIEMP